MKREIEAQDSTTLLILEMRAHRRFDMFMILVMTLMLSIVIKMCIEGSGL